MLDFFGSSPSSISPKGDQQPHCHMFLKEGKQETTKAEATMKNLGQTPRANLTDVMSLLALRSFVQEQHFNHLGFSIE